MNLTVIKSYDQYKGVLQDAEQLVALDPAAGTKDADRLELLTVILEDFERRHFSMPSPDPIDAIEFRMAGRGCVKKTWFRCWEVAVVYLRYWHVNGH